MIQLTFEQFKDDYSKVVTKEADQAFMRQWLEALITRHYPHIELQCKIWLKKEHNISLEA